MIVVVIAAIFISVVAPTFQSTIERNKRLSALEDVLAMLAAARSEAISMAAPVAVCPSTNQATCSGTEWAAGHLIFIDDGAGSGTALDRNLNGDEELLRVGGASGSGITVRTANFGDAGGILFDADGLAEERGTLVVCDGNGASYASAVVLNRSGQARLATDDDGNGVVEDDRDPAVNVTCP
jgi:type IV fimbrial biogenesis protein FimT